MEKHGRYFVGMHFDEAYGGTVLGVDLREDLVLHRYPERCTELDPVHRARREQGEEPPSRELSDRPSLGEMAPQGDRDEQRHAVGSGHGLPPLALVALAEVDSQVADGLRDRLHCPRLSSVDLSKASKETLKLKDAFEVHRSRR